MAQKNPTLANISKFISKHIFSLLFTIVILFLSLAKINEPSQIQKIPYADKLVHFALYFILTLILRKEKIKKSIIFIYALCLGATTEILQGLLTTYRTPDILDFLADAIGTLIALYHNKIIQTL